MTTLPVSILHSIATHYHRDGQDFCERFDLLWEAQPHKTGRIKKHVLDIVQDADPLETLAALYHDSVYVQVDLGVTARFAALLQPLIRKEEGGCRI